MQTSVRDRGRDSTDTRVAEINDERKSESARMVNELLGPHRAAFSRGLPSRGQSGSRQDLSAPITVMA